MCSQVAQLCCLTAKQYPLLLWGEKKNKTPQVLHMYSFKNRAKQMEYLNSPNHYASVSELLDVFHGVHPWL